MNFKMFFLGINNITPIKLRAFHHKLQYKNGKNQKAHFVQLPSMLPKFFKRMSSHHLKPPNPLSSYHPNHLWSYQLPSSHHTSHHCKHYCSCIQISKRCKKSFISTSASCSNIFGLHTVNNKMMGFVFQAGFFKVWHYWSNPGMPVKYPLTQFSKALE